MKKYTYTISIGTDGDIHMREFSQTPSTDEPTYYFYWQTDDIDTFLLDLSEDIVDTKLSCLAYCIARIRETKYLTGECTNWNYSITITREKQCTTYT